MKKIILLLAIALLCSWQVVLAQKTITGIVSDDKDGTTLPGVSVVVKGTSVGTTTDLKGAYKLAVPSSGTALVFSIIGYTSQEVAITGKLTIDVQLKASAQDLSEVVVTALGMKREMKTLGYAMTSIKAVDITAAGNTQNPLTSLYGKAAGVGLSIGSAGPTGGINIKIRGSAGLQTDTKTRPLFVIDGVPMYDENSNMANRGYDPLNSFDYGTGINDLNGEDIESIDILKGAAASVLYGSKAGNGVIMITTKKGQKTRGLGVTITYQNTFEKPVSFINWQNEYGSGSSIYDTVYALNTKFGPKVRKMNNGRQQFGPKFDGSPIMNYDSTMTTYKAYPDNWIDMFHKTNTNVVTAAISGANEKGSMRLAFTNKDYQGQMANFYQKDNSVSFSGQINASDMAKFEVTANLHKVRTQNRYPNMARLVSYGFNRDLDYQGLAYLYKDKLGQKGKLENYGLPMSFDSYGYMNILWEQNENQNIDDKLHFTGSIKVDLKFTPWLSLTGNAGTDFTDWDFTTKNKVTQITPTVQGGAYAFSRRNIVVQNYNAFLNFNKKFLNDKLDVLIFAGPEYNKVSDNSLGVSTYGGLQFADWYWLDASRITSGSSYQFRSGATSSQVLYGLLGAASFGWDNAYYLEIGARNDWSSLLPPKNNSYFYPKLSLNWIVSETQKIPKMTFGKVRFSVADVGRGAPYPYFAYPAYSVGSISNLPTVTVGGPSSLFSGDIKPERNREWEIGFDTRWFEKKPLEVDFSFYTGNTYDQIMALNLTTSTGFSNIKLNAGNVKKWGYELFLKYSPVVSDKFKWDISFNTANWKSKVIKLYPGITQYNINGGTSYSIMAVEGQPNGNVWMYDYLRDPNGTRVVSKSGTYTADKSKWVTAANINPKFLGGFSTDLFYKNFNFHASFDYKFGGSYLSMSNYYLLGNGQSKESLQYRDEANGGLAYYIDNTTGNMVPWQHSSPAPAAARLGRVYHNGVILEGVKEVTDASGNVTGYKPNDVMITDITYYSQYIQDMNEWFQPDNLLKNDYIKVREAALMYTIPKSITSKMKLQKVSVSLIARNLFYLYKTIKNIDPESSLGSDQFTEYSPLPQMRTYGFRVDLSF
jgi:TonB-linked SusC/RagA family outer membrane protein